MNMRILILGDLVGRTGRDAAVAALPGLRAQTKADCVVVNAENASHGFGLAPDMADALFAAGADAITLGNHAWDRREIIPYIAKEPRLIRPLNFPPGTPGNGASIIPLKDGRKVLVAQLMGRLFMDPLDDPFRLMEELLVRNKMGVNCHAALVDFHGEATSEKMAFAHNLTAGFRLWLVLIRISQQRIIRCCQAGLGLPPILVCAGTTTA